MQAFWFLLRSSLLSGRKGKGELGRVESGWREIATAAVETESATAATKSKGSNVAIDRGIRDRFVSLLLLLSLFFYSSSSSSSYFFEVWLQERVEVLVLGSIRIRASNEI